MQVEELVSGARDVMSVKRVYGEPYEKNGLAVIPAATVRGGGGGGTGENEGGESGGGGGFGMIARPSRRGSSRTVRSPGSPRST